MRVVVEEDPDPDVSYLEQDGFDERLAAYRNGEFSIVGVRAEADVFIEETEQTLTSSGLWGVESDLDEGELIESAQAEWEALRNVLKAVGVSTSELPLDAQREWIEWRT